MSLLLFLEHGYSKTKAKRIPQETVIQVSMIIVSDNIQHMGKFTDVHEFVFDVFVLSTLAFIMTILFGSRLRKEKNNNKNSIF